MIVLEDLSSGVYGEKVLSGTLQMDKNEIL